MKNIEYSYILELYNKTYNENIDEEQFDELLKTKYKRNKISLKNELLKTKEQEIMNMLKKIKNYKDIPEELIEYFKMIKKMKTYSLKTLINKIKNYDQLENKINEKLKIIKVNYYKEELNKLKLKIKDKELYKYSLEEIEFLLEELNKEYIIDYMDEIEEEFICAIENIDKMINYSIVINNKNEIDNTDSKENIKKEIKENKYKEDEKINHKINTDESIKNNNKILETNNQTSKYTKYLKNSLLYFDVVKLEVATLNLEENKEIEIFKYIDKLKMEYIYLFTTTLNYNDKKTVIKMLSSLDRLVEKKLNDNSNKIYVKEAA